MRATTLIITLLLTGCSSIHPLTRSPGGAPLYVAVLPIEADAGVVLRAPSSSTIRTLLGADAPQRDLEDLLRDALRMEGYRVQDAAITQDKLYGTDAPQSDDATAAVTALAAHLGVDGVLTADVRDWDATALTSQGRLKIDLHVTLWSRTGERLWSAESSPKVVGVQLYRARHDVRAHLVKAVDSLF